MIQEQNATVFYSPTMGRRYLNKYAAISAEARALIYKKYPQEAFEPDTGHCYDIATHEADKYNKLHKRLYRLILRST